MGAPNTPSLRKPTATGVNDSAAVVYHTGTMRIRADIIEARSYIFATLVQSVSAPMSVPIEN